MRIRSFGLKLSALSMNLLARAALTPKGGLSPIICLQNGTDINSKVSAEEFRDTRI